MIGPARDSRGGSNRQAFNALNREQNRKGGEGNANSARHGTREIRRDTDAPEARAPEALAAGILLVAAKGGQ